MSTATGQHTTDRQSLLKSEDSDRPIVFFDGVCGLCSRAVDWIIARDRQGVFRFAPLQGETARRRLSEDDIAALDTMAVATGSGVFRRSSAAVQILWRLGPLWRGCGWLLWAVPRPLRDLGYRAVAQTRYRLFGKHETCRLPTPEERERFLP